MRIDLPQCGFHYCRFQFDGNCTSTGKYEKCEYRYLSEQIKPERKKGKWLTSDDMYETGVCSVCKCDSQEPIPYAMTMFKYCPHCGADMRGEQE